MHAYISSETKEVHLDFGLFELTKIKISRHSETSRMLTIQYRLKTLTGDLKTMHRRMMYDVGIMTCYLEQKNTVLRRLARRDIVRHLSAC